MLVYVNLHTETDMLTKRWFIQLKGRDNIQCKLINQQNLQDGAIDYSSLINYANE